MADRTSKNLSDRVLRQETRMENVATKADLLNVEKTLQGEMKSLNARMDYLATKEDIVNVEKTILKFQIWILTGIVSVFITTILIAVRLFALLQP